MSLVSFSELELSRGWSVLQDVHDNGEELGIFRPDWTPEGILPEVSEWEPIDHLAHLQLLFADHPYFGRALRYFNEHAWWYRLEFQLPPDRGGFAAALRIEGADYFAKVWLNGAFLGEHEGYFAPFEFEVGHLLESVKSNLLVIKVWSPWEDKSWQGRAPEHPDLRVGFPSAAIGSGGVWQGRAAEHPDLRARNLVKGTYAHADTLIQRDVNPVGLWGNVRLLLHCGARLAGQPIVESRLADDSNQAEVAITFPIIAVQNVGEVVLACSIRDDDSGREVVHGEMRASVPIGRNTPQLQLMVDRPKFWSTWDQGDPNLYRAEIDLRVGDTLVQHTSERFGIRQVELRRTPDETTCYLNARRFFCRGTNYFPDIYLSGLSRSRYARDLAAIRRAGCNAVRVPVHVERPEFYELCDELGIAVLQDSDLNVAHPTDSAWTERAVAVFGDMIGCLRNHPSVIIWLCFNEPMGEMNGTQRTERPIPQLVAEAKRLDPWRPTIAGSSLADDLESGDSHTYLGSLRGETRYTEIQGRKTKLNTEFGFDAPPVAADLSREPLVYERLKAIADHFDLLQHYQYRLLKYYIEHYRIAKYRPCSGYFQFMFIDNSPQGFYGVYDWWGVPKKGLQAFEESSQPLGVFLEQSNGPVAVWMVNDLPRAFLQCTVEWLVMDEASAVLESGCVSVDLPADSAVRATDLSFPVDPDRCYRITLWMRDSGGAVLARNKYVDPFRHPPHPKGHPDRMSHELGVRLYDA